MNKSIEQRILDELSVPQPGRHFPEIPKEYVVVGVEYPSDEEKRAFEALKLLHPDWQFRWCDRVGSNIFEYTRSTWFEQTTCLDLGQAQAMVEMEADLSEKNFWNYLRKGMVGVWHAQRHEDRTAKGVPDVSYGLEGVSGWIELKWLPELPAKVGDVVRIPHLTTEQRQWLRDRRAHCPHVYVFLKVADVYVLIDAKDIDLVGHVPIGALIKMSVAWWRKSVVFDQLRAVLCQRSVDKGQPKMEALPPPDDELMDW